MHLAQERSRAATRLAIQMPQTGSGSSRSPSRPLMFYARGAAAALGSPPAFSVMVFGLSRETIQRVPYTARSVVEDLEYHLSLVREGINVEFLEETEVRADQPVGDKGTESQRARWEGGRFRMVREHLPGLARDVLLGRWRSLEPMLELSLLPLAVHVGTLGVVLLIPFPPTQLYAAGSLAVVAAHVGASLLVGGGTAEDLLALVRAPKYVAWKLGLMPKVVDAARGSQAWVRTDREAAADASK